MLDDENNPKTNDDKPERLKWIENLIKGTSYNNTAVREAIYMVVISSFDKLQSTMQILVEMIEHKNNGATAKTITDYSAQLFVEEIVISDKTTDRYQLASVKLIKQRLNKKTWETMEWPTNTIEKNAWKEVLCDKIEHSFEVLDEL